MQAKMIEKKIRAKKKVKKKIMHKEKFNIENIL